MNTPIIFEQLQHLLGNCSSPKSATIYFQGQLRPRFYDRAADLIEYFINESNGYVKELNSRSSSDVYVGYGGVALTHFMIHLKTGRAGSFETADYLTNMALQRLSGRRVSFLQGDAGPLALAAAMNFTRSRVRQAMGLVNRLIDLGLKAKNQDFEVLNGWAGYLFALQYVNSFNRDSVPTDIMRKHVERILFEGYNEARRIRSPVPLVYSWNDSNYYGAAHGVAGILYMILRSGVLSNSEMLNLVKPTLDHLIDTRFSGGNYRSSEDSNSDKLVQWCHGAPGFTDLLALAYEFFGDGAYLTRAEEASDVVWQRGLLTKGYSICHGTSGNAYSFLTLFKKTKSLKQLYRAASYFDWALTYPNNEGHRPDRPFSLFEGQAGILYFLTEMRDPATAAFPAYCLS